MKQPCHRHHLACRYPVVRLAVAASPLQLHLSPYRYQQLMTVLQSALATPAGAAADGSSDTAAAGSDKPLWLSESEYTAKVIPAVVHHPAPRWPAIPGLPFVVAGAAWAGVMPFKCLLAGVDRVQGGSCDVGSLGSTSKKQSTHLFAWGLAVHMPRVLPRTCAQSHIFVANAVWVP